MNQAERAPIPHFYQTIPGYFTGQDFYSWLAREFPNGHGVEVGSFMGRSAAYLATEILNLGGAAFPGRLDLVDTFKASPGGAPAVRQLLSPVAAVIGDMLECLSWDAAALYPNASLDYVYIDADHSYEAVCRDIDAWLPKVKPGGVICGHDFCPYPGYGVIQAVMERFDRVEVWPGERFFGDGVRVFENRDGMGLRYPSWCARVKPAIDTRGFYGEAFFGEMRAGREASRRLGDCIHNVIGEPQLAIDLGSGIGIQTARLKELGWSIVGADFAPLASTLREPDVNVLPFDLTVLGGGGGMLEPVDCVICTEVAEHVPEQFSDVVVRNIASLARKFVVWSAAPPGQGGTGHINLQPPEAWLERFKALNWAVSHPRTQKLRTAMRITRAQHAAYADNFFVLMPVDNTEAFYEFMRSCRDNYRKLADCIHEVVGAHCSALDIGCGIGIQTARLRELGWTAIEGADFAPAAREMRESGVEILPFDLTAHATQAKPVSCVICTEVAEHIPHAHADAIVDNVTRYALNTIVWSAACPWQVEPYHINLQYPPYWLDRFKAKGWVVDQKRSAELKQLMLERQAQHWYGRENFFVLVPQKPLHMTIVGTALNAEKWIGKHIESVQSQTFRNFTHVVIDAASEDFTHAVARTYAHRARAGQLSETIVCGDGQVGFGSKTAGCARRQGEDIRLIRNDIRLSSLENCWNIWKTLPDDEVIVWLDGDDWLAHDEALAVLAKVYESPAEPWVTYGSFMLIDGEVGFAGPYHPGEEPRNSPWRATHLKTFRAGLVKRLIRDSAFRSEPITNVVPRCLLRPDGSWVEHATDKAVMYPLLEMAGEHQAFVSQILCVYNYHASCATRERSAELDVELAEVTRLQGLPRFDRLTERPW